MSAEAPLYDVHILLQSCASMPDGPAEPVVLNALYRYVFCNVMLFIINVRGFSYKNVRARLYISETPSK